MATSFKQFLQLTELFNQEKSDQRWTDQLQALIDKHGLKKFIGNQATVVTSDDRKHVYRIWAKDPGYEHWIQEALKMQNNPYVIKVLGKIRTINTQFKNLPNDVKLKVVKLEKLQPLAGNEMLEATIFSIADVINNWSSSERNEHDVDSFIRTVEASSEEYSAAPVHEAVMKFCNEHRKFLETVLELSRHGYNDWGIENIMMRGKIPVIVDPYSQN